MKHLRSMFVLAFLVLTTKVQAAEPTLICTSEKGYVLTYTRTLDTNHSWCKAHEGRMELTVLATIDPDQILSPKDALTLSGKMEDDNCSKRGLRFVGKIFSEATQLGDHSSVVATFIADFLMAPTLYLSDGVNEAKQIKMKCNPAVRPTLSE